MLKQFKHIPKQVFIFSIISAVFICPYLIRFGIGPVTGTYKGAAWGFWIRNNPYYYAMWGGDWFKYSPFFAFCYTPFSLMGPTWQAVAWGLTNIVIYWWGISRWFVLRKSSSAWLWFAVVLCSMELDGSARYQQINPLLIGMILGALADYRDGKFARAGFWLMIATNFKLIPAIFLFTQRWNKPFIKGMFAAGVLSLVVPLLWLGPHDLWMWHRTWAEVLLRDTRTEGLLDLETVLTRWNYPALGHWLKIAVTVISLATLALGRRAVPILLMMLILISPRTESATFVVAAPVFLFLAEAMEKLEPRKRWAARAVFLACAFFITLSFNDVWPKALFRPTLYHYATKTLGMLGLWALGLALLGKTRDA